MIAVEQATRETTSSPRIPDPVEVPSKVQPRHLGRLALVYVRQSTLQQVQEHRESTALQYALRSRAIAWGWGGERVLVIDEDLGCSGASAEGRAGFQRLLAEVSLGHVGVVLGIEMSRLARSCRDWHQLLGLKGTLSEAELHVLRQRMNEGRLNKARRGALFNHPPMGYVRLPAGELGIDPDQQVQSVIRARRCATCCTIRSTPGPTPGEGARSIHAARCPGGRAQAGRSRPRSSAGCC